jgi:hypothetical protein
MWDGFTMRADMDLKKIISKILTILSRYRDERFTGKITVTFNFSQGGLGDVDFGTNHKMKS